MDMWVRGMVGGVVLQILEGEDDRSASRGPVCCVFLCVFFSLRRIGA